MDRQDDLHTSHFHWKPAIRRKMWVLNHVFCDGESLVCHWVLMAAGRSRGRGMLRALHGGIRRTCGLGPVSLRSQLLPQRSSSWHGDRKQG